MGFTKLGLGLRLFFEFLLCSSQFYIHRIFGFFIFLFLFLKRCNLIRKNQGSVCHIPQCIKGAKKVHLCHTSPRKACSFLDMHPFDFLGLNAFLSRFALRCTYKTPLKTLLLINLVILQFQNCFLWKQPMRYLSFSSHNK